jgi:hypothetical protein
MQNSYVHNAGQWHLVNGTYAHHNGQWHLVQNAYVHHNGQWHLAQSAGSNLDQIYDTPGDFTYKVPDGVYNIEFTYPTPTGMKTFGIPKVTPGQEIPIKVGEYGTTSSVIVSSSTYVLPAFDVPVLGLVTLVDGWLNVEFSAASPTGASVTTTSGTNDSASAAALAAGALYTVEYEGYQGSLQSSMSLTPVKSDYIINWPRARILETKWGGRNHTRTTGQLTVKGNYYTYKFGQNDDPDKWSGSYIYNYNLQQILKIVVSPAGTSTVAGGSIIVSPSSFSANAIKSTLFTQQFEASGGTTPYTWRASVGAISSDGLWSYTPPAAGTLSVVITATSANSLLGTITPLLNITNTGVDGGGAMVISPTSLPNGTQNVAYSQSVTVSGGVAPYSWNVASATTVDGISISASGATLTVTGTPTVDGSVTIPYTITDSSAGGVITLSGSLGFTVAAAVVTTETLTIFTGFISSPATSYPTPFTPSVTYTKTGGGSGTLIWQLSNGTNVYNGSQSITSGSPASLSINAATGTNYTLTANVGSVNATPATGIPIG